MEKDAVATDNHHLKVQLQGAADRVDAQLGEVRELKEQLMHGGWYTVDGGYG